MAEGIFLYVQKLQGSVIYLFMYFAHFFIRFLVFF